MTVGIGIVTPGDIEIALEFDKARHGVGAGAVHTDFAVVVHGHERELGVHFAIDHFEAEAKLVRNGFPVRYRRAAQRIDAEAQMSAANGVHVDYVSEVLDVGGQQIYFVSGSGFDGGFVRHAGDFPRAAQNVVGAILNPAGDVRVGGSAVRGIVFETAIVGRVMRRGDDDAVRETGGTAAVIGEDGVGNDGRGGEPVARLNPGGDAVCSEHFERSSLRGAG